MNGLHYGHIIHKWNMLQIYFVNLQNMVKFASLWNTVTYNLPDITTFLPPE